MEVSTHNIIWNDMRTFTSCPAGGVSLVVPSLEGELSKQLLQLVMVLFNSLQSKGTCTFSVPALLIQKWDGISLVFASSATHSVQFSFISLSKPQHWSTGCRSLTSNKNPSLPHKSLHVSHPVFLRLPRRSLKSHFLWVGLYGPKGLRTAVPILFWIWQLVCHHTPTVLSTQ